MARLVKTVALVAGAGAVLVAGAGVAVADSGAQGAAVGSPGVVSGNNIQAPIHIPVNLCGNSVNLGGLLNPTFGNVCINHSGDHADHKKKKHHHGW